MNHNNPIVIYGATGYTGQLVARLAAARSLPVTLAGRDAQKLRTLAEPLGLAWRAFSLSDPAAVDAALAGVQLVLHLAGPYRKTAAPMRAACLRNKCHYLDITGELEVYADHLQQDAAARAAGVVLLTGVGFDVVPSDCLAAWVCEHLPDVQRLDFFYDGGASMSRGTMESGLSMVGGGTPVVRKGKLVRMSRPPCARADLGKGEADFVASAWGDLITAAHSTGAADITTYFPAAASMVGSGFFAPFRNWLLGLAPVRVLLAGIIRFLPEGPTDDARQQAEQRILVVAENTRGETVRALLVTPEAYTLTAETALAAALQILQQPPAPGFHTPATALGADFIVRIAGVERCLVAAPVAKEVA